MLHNSVARRWKAIGAFLVLLLVSATLLVVGGDYLLGRSLVFFPEREIEHTPADWGLPFEDVTFFTLDGVNSRVVPRNKTAAPA